MLARHSMLGLTVALVDSVIFEGLPTEPGEGEQAREEASFSMSCRCGSRTWTKSWTVRVSTACAKMHV